MKQEMCGKGLYVLYMDDYTAHDIESLVEQLPAWRREQALRYRHEAGRRQCVLAYEALRRGLRERYGIAEDPGFDYNSYGKPSLHRLPHIHFSLSHCREAVGCLLSDSECGLDLEASRPVRESLVRYTMNEAEQALISQAPRPDVAFIRLWTMKEAVVKCTGHGISNDMKHVLDGISGIQTITNVERGYIYSVYMQPLSSQPV